MVHVGAVQHTEAPRLLQVRHQDALGLVAQTVFTILEDAVHVAGLVGELAHGDQRLLAVVRRVVGVDLLALDHARAFGGTTGQTQQGNAQGNGNQFFHDGISP